MRQTTTAELRLGEGKAASSSATRPSLSPFLAFRASAAIEFPCRAPRRDGKLHPTHRESGECRIMLNAALWVHRREAKHVREKADFLCFVLILNQTVKL
jgi:hypothetical protein